MFNFSNDSNLFIQQIPPTIKWFEASPRALFKEWYPRILDSITPQGYYTVHRVRLLRQGDPKFIVFKNTTYQLLLLQGPGWDEKQNWM